MRRRRARPTSRSRRSAPDDEARLRLVKEGLRVLQGGAGPRYALQAAEHELAPFLDRDEVLLMLVDLARAADDQAAAARWMRRLMRMGGAPAWREALALLVELLVPSAHAAEGPGEGVRPYDERLYGLAWDVFVAGGRLEDAMRVAQAAVAQLPGDLRWRERLAQVAEWLGRSQAALAQRLAIARATGTEAAWQ